MGIGEFLTEGILVVFFNFAFEKAENTKSKMKKKISQIWGVADKQRQVMIFVEFLLHMSEL